MDQPLCVIRNASTSSLSAKTYDVLILRDRLLVVRGPGATAMMRGSGSHDVEFAGEPRLDRRRFQVAHEAIDVQARIADARIRELLAASEDELLARADENRRIVLAEIESARLDVRRLTCKLRLRLHDGEKLRWSFLDGSLGAEHDRLAGVLSLLLGPRLTRARA